MPLRLRLAPLFALGVAVMISTATLAFVPRLRVSLDTALDPGLRTRVQVVAQELSSRGTPQLDPAEGIVQFRTLDTGLLAFSPLAGTRSLLDATQRQQALAGEVSFTATVSGNRSRLLATTTSLRDGRRVLVVVGTGTDVSDDAVDDVQTAFLVGGPPAVLLAVPVLGTDAVARPAQRRRPGRECPCRRPGCHRAGAQSR